MAEPNTMAKTIRVTPESWALFEQFRRGLEQTLPYGRVPLHEAFTIAVNSAQAQLNDGQLVVTSRSRDPSEPR